MKPPNTDPQKPLAINVFVNLVGPRKVTYDPTKPDVKARLTAFGAAYRLAMANPTTTHDFPNPQSLQAWLDSFDAYERLVVVAGALERTETPHPAGTLVLDPSDVDRLQAIHDGAPVEMPDPSPDPEPEPEPL